MPASEPYTLTFENLTKRFGSITANDRVSLSVRRGELMTLLGPSGCGKTTLLRCVSGSLTADEGTIRIDGKDVTGVPTYQRDLGMVFQSFALFPHLTVHGNVDFPLKVKGVEKAERRKRVEEALEMIKLREYAKHYPRHLSGGQQQRVGLARALVSRPKILLMDEPLSNLDAKLREEMRFEIKELQSQLGMTTIYVTHDQEEALALSDRLAIMNEGRIHQVGTPTEIYERPETKFVADFVGRANFIRGRIVEIDDGGTAVVVTPKMEEVGRLRVPLAGGTREGQVVSVLIRPHQVELLPPADKRPDNLLGGIVTSAVYLGEKMEYRVTVADGLELRVQVEGSGTLTKGESVVLHLPSDKCRIVVE